jgi:hydrogenase-4 component F
VLPIIVLLSGPFIAGLLSLVIRRSRLLHVVNFSTMLALAGADTALTTQILSHGPITALGDLVYIDALSAFILFIITTIGLSFALYVVLYGRTGGARRHCAKTTQCVVLPLSHVPTRHGGGHHRQ